MLKISILLFYRRIVNGTFQLRWRLAVWLAIRFTVAYTIALALALCLSCQPIQAYWRILDLAWVRQHSFECHLSKAYNPLAGGLTIFSDLYSVLLPCLMCRNLSMPFWQKVALYGLFCTGFLVAAAAGVRTLALTTMFGLQNDMTW